MYAFDSVHSRFVVNCYLYHRGRIKICHVNTTASDSTHLEVWRGHLFTILANVFSNTCRAFLSLKKQVFLRVLQMYFAWFTFVQLNSDTVPMITTNLIQKNKIIIIILVIIWYVMDGNWLLFCFFIRKSPFISISFYWGM